MLKAQKQRFVISPRCRRLIQHHNVYVWQTLVLPAKRLSYDSFQAVSVGREPAVFLAYCQSKPRRIRIAVTIKHRKKLIAASGCFLEDAAEGCLIS